MSCVKSYCLTSWITLPVKHRELIHFLNQHETKSEMQGISMRMSLSQTRLGSNFIFQDRPKPYLTAILDGYKIERLLTTTRNEKLGWLRISHLSDIHLNVIDWCRKIHAFVVINHEIEIIWWVTLEIFIGITILATLPFNDFNHIYIQYI